jgi:hypothetical protein
MGIESESSSSSIVVSTVLPSVPVPTPLSVPDELARNVQAG